MTDTMAGEGVVKCAKCGARHGDDWKQCGGACPMQGSPHYVPETLAAISSEQSVREASAYRDGLAHGFKLGLAGDEAEYDRQKAWRVAEIIEARKALAAQPSAGAQGYVTDEWAERFCEAVNWSPDGQECKVVEGEMRCTTFREIAKGHILAVIATDPHPIATPAQPDTGHPSPPNLLAGQGKGD